MPKLNLRKKIPVGDVEAALRNRFKDRSSSRRDLQMRAALTRPSALNLHAAPGSIIQARDEHRRMRDIGLALELENRSAEALEAYLHANDRGIENFIKNLNDSMAVSSDLLDEASVQVKQNYSNVALNAFQTRGDLERQRLLIRKDPKTTDGMSPDLIIEPVRRLGLTQPLIKEEVLPCESAYVDDEYSTFEYTVYDDDPCLLCEAGNNEPWRRVIMVSERSDTNRSWTARKTQAYLVLGLELTHRQIANGFRIRSASQSALRIADLEYWDGAAWQSILTWKVLEDRRTFLFSPVETKYFRITLAATPLERRTVDTAYSEVDEILESSGYTQRYVTETGRVIDGSVFDFSLYSVEPLRRAYRPQGAYQGPPVSTINPVGASIRDVVSATSATGGFIERYLHIKAETEEAWSALVPLPDSVDPTVSQQKELLYPVANRSAVKLYPDLERGMTRFEVVSTVITTASGVTYVNVTTSEPHGLSGGASIRFSNVSDLPDTYVISAVGSTTTLSFVFTGTHAELDGSETPQPYVYPVAGQPEPVVVYEDGVALTLGSDYEYSIDGGATWLDEWDRNTPSNPRAGNFLISIASVDPVSRYRIEYQHHARQWLGDYARLRNSVVEFESNADGRVAMRPIFVFRSEDASRYETLQLEKYWLRITDDSRGLQ